MMVTLYSSYWCPDCRTAKRFLAENNIPYREVDIESTPGAAEEVVRRTGKRAIPQFVINGQWIQPYRPGEGFLYDEMKTLLGINSPQESPAKARTGGAHDALASRLP
jgi:mycoredoxin